MIHPQALIDPGAELASDVTVGPFSIIGPNVKIDQGTWIGPSTVIRGNTEIGKENKIYQFASIGEDCQDKKYRGESSKLKIGSHNIFREGCTIHRGTEQGGGITEIGDHNLFMVNSHVAHDCFIGNHVIFSNGASIAGHVKIGDYATLGGLVGIHQFCNIGAYSFAAGGAIIFKDVLPFVMVAGNPAKSHGLNLVGLQRRNFTQETIAILQQAYKIIFRSKYTVKEVIQQLAPMTDNCLHVRLLSDFLQAANRGIIR